MSARDLLFELGTEELPPKSLELLSTALVQHVVESLEKAGLTHGQVERFATPRRLAFIVHGLSAQQPDQTVERKGPPIKAAFSADGTPTKAALAFAESVGISVDKVERVTEAKGEFLFHRGVKPGQQTTAIIAGIIESAIAALPIAKRMRWGNSSAEFVRPVHWVVLLWGQDVIPAEFFGLNTARLTYGHRFMAPQALTLNTPSEYTSALKQAFVLADPQARRATVVAQIQACAQALNGQALLRDALVDEVTALVEWPVAVTGQFAERFLNLPREALTATLEDHQRYFSIQDAHGALTTQFVTIANVASRDESEVRRGNERVVRPRLADAEFFWNLDRTKTLASRTADLTQVTFQAALGSYADKSHRITRLAEVIADRLGFESDKTKLTIRAAQLCKTDLITGMVGEFPELQGIMGGYYATADGESPVVAAAIAEHYHPRFAQDRIPASDVGCVVALADKIDTIASIFAIGQKPSGTRDPYALRRQVLGVLRIILELNVELNLGELLQIALQQSRLQAVKLNPSEKGLPTLAEIETELRAYVFERLRGYLLEENPAVTTEMIDAVLTLQTDSPVDFKLRVTALTEFVQLPEAQAITHAQKRIVNLFKKSHPTAQATVAATAFTLPVEQTLFTVLSELKPKVAALVTARRYAEALRITASLRAPIDAFFDGVMVMDDDLSVRERRLALLNDIRNLFLMVADLSALPGQS
jgi:glycyl-tRNA synthetase beta chain